MQIILDIVGRLVFFLPELIMGPPNEHRAGRELSQADLLGRWLVTAVVWLLLVVGLLSLYWALRD